MKLNQEMRFRKSTRFRILLDMNRQTTFDTNIVDCKFNFYS